MALGDGCGVRVATRLGEGRTSVRWATRDQRPDIAGIPPLDVWPEYNLYGDVVGVVWSCLYDAVPQFQSVCWDEQTGQVLAEANAIPCWWDGTDDGLGPGIDATMADAVARLDADEPANALCALAGIVAPAARGRGLAAEVLRQCIGSPPRMGWVR